MSCQPVPQEPSEFLAACKFEQGSPVQHEGGLYAVCRIVREDPREDEHPAYVTTKYSMLLTRNEDGSPDETSLIFVFADSIDFHNGFWSWCSISRGTDPEALIAIVKYESESLAVQLPTGPADIEDLVQVLVGGGSGRGSAEEAATLPLFARCVLAGIRHGAADHEARLARPDLNQQELAVQHGAAGTAPALVQYTRRMEIDKKQGKKYGLCMEYKKVFEGFTINFVSAETSLHSICRAGPEVSAPTGQPGDIKLAVHDQHLLVERGRDGKNFVKSQSGQLRVRAFRTACVGAVPVAHPPSSPSEAYWLFAFGLRPHWWRLLDGHNVHGIPTE